MVKTASKPKTLLSSNALPTLRAKLGMTQKLLFQLSGLPLLCLLLAGCTLGSQPDLSLTPTTVAELCKPWRSITYSSTKDTPVTVRQVRVHNKTGANLGCWKG